MPERERDLSSGKSWVSWSVGEAGAKQGGATQSLQREQRLLQPGAADDCIPDGLAERLHFRQMLERGWPCVTGELGQMVRRKVERCKRKNIATRVNCGVNTSSTLHINVPYLYVHDLGLFVSKALMK